MVIDELSPREAAIVNLIRAAAACGQPVPSQQELAAAIGVRSASTVNRHLQALARKGVLKWTRWRNRAIVLVEKAERCPGCGRTRDLPEETGTRSEGTLRLSATEAAVFVAICETLQADRMVSPPTLARQLDRHIVEIWRAVDALRVLAFFAVASASPPSPPEEYPQIQPARRTVPGPPAAARHDITTLIQREAPCERQVAGSDGNVDGAKHVRLAICAREETTSDEGKTRLG